MNTPADSSEMRAPWWLRIVRSTSVVALMLSWTVISMMCALGWLAGAGDAFEETFLHAQSASAPARIVLALTFIAAVCAPGVILIVARRRGWLTWRFHAGAWAGVLGIFVWLSWDEPTVRHLVPLEDFSPAFPGAEKSHATLMHYSTVNSTREAQAFAQMKWQTVFGNPGGIPGDAGRWHEFVRGHREAIQADWIALQPQRAWLEELAAFDRIGDLTSPGFKDGVPAFRVWRSLAQITCAHATGLALDGRRDEAIGTLVPLLGTARKLQIYSRTLVRSMVAIVVERMCIETAQLILDQGPVSPETQAALVAALGKDNAAVMARRLVLTEYVIMAPYLDHTKPSEWTETKSGIARVFIGALDLVAGIFINLNATINLYGDHAFTIAQLAESRELGKLAVEEKAYFRRFSGPARGFGPKNLIGRLIVVRMPPTFEKVVASHWKVADAATALRRKLAE